MLTIKQKREQFVRPFPIKSDGNNSLRSLTIDIKSKLFTPTFLLNLQKALVQDDIDSIIQQRADFDRVDKSINKFFLEDSVFHNSDFLNSNFKVSFRYYDDEFTNNLDKYMEEESRLSQDPKYRGKYIVIYKGEIVDVGEDKEKLLHNAYQKFGYVPLLVHKVGTRRIINHLSPFRR